MKMIGRVETFSEAVSLIKQHARISADAYAEPYPSEGKKKGKRTDRLAGPPIMAFTFLSPDRSRDEGEPIAVGCYFTATGAVQLYDPPQAINDRARAAAGAYRIKVANPKSRARA